MTDKTVYGRLVVHDLEKLTQKDRADIAIWLVRIGTSLVTTPQEELGHRLDSTWTRHNIEASEALYK